MPKISHITHAESIAGYFRSTCLKKGPIVQPSKSTFCLINMIKNEYTYNFHWKCHNEQSHGFVLLNLRILRMT